MSLWLLTCEITVSYVTRHLRKDLHYDVYVNVKKQNVTVKHLFIYTAMRFI